MKREVYLQILNEIQSRSGLVNIADKYGVPYQVVRGIYARKVQKKQADESKSSYAKAPKLLEEYLRRVGHTDEDVLVAMSESENMQSAMLARYVLGALHQRLFGRTDKEKVSSWVKNPDSLMELSAKIAGIGLGPGAGGSGNTGDIKRLDSAR